MKDVLRKLIRTEQDFNEMLKEIEDFNIMSFDTENKGLNPKFAIPAGFSIYGEWDKSYYIPINHTDIKTNFHLRFNEILKNKKIIIMHNAVYDAGIVKFHYNTNLEKYYWWDTMIGQHLLTEEDRVGLKYLTEKYFNTKQTSFKEVMKSKELTDPTKVSAESIYKYACDDAIFTYKHYLRIEKGLEKEGLNQLFLKVEMPFQKTLLHIRSNGIVFDSELNEKIEKDLHKRKKELVQEIINVTPQINVIKNFLGEKVITINLSSSIDLQKLLYKKLKLPIKGYTKAGSPASDVKTLILLKSNDKWLHPIIPLLMGYKKGEKLLTSYTSTLREKVMKDGKLYTDLLDHGTTEGRLSSRNPNFQQLPRKREDEEFPIRNCFTISPKYKMLVVDFSQEEVRICGIISHSKTLKEAFIKEQDIHLSVANTVWNLGIPKECLKETHSDFKKYFSKFKKKRTAAKSITFGIMYGTTSFGLAAELGISEEEAQKIINDYFNTFPEINTAINNTKKEVKLKGFVRNLYSRKRRFTKTKKDGHSFYNKKCFRQAFNHKIQGTASDILRVVMNNLYKYIKTTNNKVKMLTTIHDEVVFEIIDNEEFEIHKNKIVEIMENSVKVSIPLTVDCGEGYNYGEAK